MIADSKKPIQVMTDLCDLKQGDIVKHRGRDRPFKVTATMETAAGVIVSLRYSVTGDNEYVTGQRGDLALLRLVKPTTINYAYSKAAMQTGRSIPRSCWRNAFVIASDMRGAAGVDVFYVEGWAVFSDIVPIPIAHGWLEVGTGDKAQVIECTINLDERGKVMRHFTGSRWSCAQMLKEVRSRNGVIPLTLDGGGLPADSARAYNAAFMAGFGVDLVAAQAELTKSLQETKAHVD